MSTDHEPPHLCGERAASCVCHSPRGHTDKTHRCGESSKSGMRCGGAWSGSFKDGSFRIVGWPGVAPA